MSAPAPPPVPERFRLLRYYLLASLATIAVVTAVASYFFAREFETEIVDLSHQDAVRIVGHLQRRVGSEFIEPTIARDGYIDLEEVGHREALDQVVHSAVDELGVVRLYFFDPRGTIVFSTVHEHIGFSIEAGANPNYEAARDGLANSTLKQRGDPLDLTGETEGVYLLETYVPVRSLAGDDPEASVPFWVIETYEDAGPMVDAIRTGRRRMATMAGGAMVCLFLILLVVVAKADRRIHLGEDALRRANRQLLHLTATLEDEVDRRTAQLVEREKLASLGTLSAGVAHEVNNPLATIAVCAEGLERRLLGDGTGPLAADPTVRRYLDVIGEETFRCKEITNHLLDFSRQDATPRNEAVDLREVVESTLALLRLQGRGRQAELAFEVAADPGTIRGDPSALRQVVFNVTSNAIDATDPSGRIAWTLDRDDGHAVLVCRDDGRGIEPESLARIWDPFYTTKPAGRGTGLGLSLTFSIVRRHAGEIEIASAGPDLGTTVTIRLPIAEAAS